LQTETTNGISTVQHNRSEDKKCRFFFRISRADW